MVAFCVGGPEKALKEAEEFYRNFVGLTDIVKKTENIWILCFENKESAISAQWQLEIYGAKGVREADGQAGELE